MPILTPMGQPFLPFLFLLTGFFDATGFFDTVGLFGPVGLPGAPEALSIQELSFAGGTVQIYKKQAQVRY